MHSKSYKGADFEVGWHPDNCIHSKVCWTNMRKVFDPFRRPWIVLENGEREAIKDQVLACPSGALQWIEVSNENAEKGQNEAELLHVAPQTNGPLLVKGEFILIGADGNRELKSKTTAFCRCGGSKSKPFCDGTHNQIGFKS